MDERTRSSRLWGDDDRVMMEDRGCFLPLHFYNSVQEMVGLLLRKLDLWIMPKLIEFVAVILLMFQSKPDALK